MRNIGTEVYIMIVIMGAMMVAVTVFLMLKSTSNKNLARTQTQPVEGIETSTALGKKHPPTFGSALNNLKVLLGRSLSSFNRPTHNAPTEQPPIDEGQTINKRFSIPLPGVSNLEPEIRAVLPAPEQTVPNVAPHNEEPEVNILDTFPAKPEPGIAPVRPATEQVSEVNTIKILPAESVESTQDQAQEELELVEYEPEEIDKASENEAPEQPKAKDTVFDLFTDEITEESDVGKFAATLGDVESHDLLEKPQALMNPLRGTSR